MERQHEDLISKKIQKIDVKIGRKGRTINTKEYNASEKGNN